MAPSSTKPSALHGYLLPAAISHPPLSPAHAQIMTKPQLAAILTRPQQPAQAVSACPQPGSAACTPQAQAFFQEKLQTPSSSQGNGATPWSDPVDPQDSPVEEFWLVPGSQGPPGSCMTCQRINLGTTIVSPPSVHGPPKIKLEPQPQPQQHLRAPPTVKAEPELPLADQEGLQSAGMLGPRSGLLEQARLQTVHEAADEGALRPAPWAEWQPQGLQQLPGSRRSRAAQRPKRLFECVGEDAEDQPVDRALQEPLLQQPQQGLHQQDEEPGLQWRPEGHTPMSGLSLSHADSTGADVYSPPAMAWLLPGQASASAGVRSSLHHANPVCGSS